MPDKTDFTTDPPQSDALAVPAAASAPAPDAKPTDTWVVMHDSVSNWVKGCRVSIDDLFHRDHPTRDEAWKRLVRLGAIRPESDPVAAAVPVAEPLPSPPPIMMASAAGQLTVSMPAPKQP